MEIKLLDQATINKIAAGEVIERPSSVVKELVENAIDAGATAITVEIKDGGISFIRVTDNGSGINKNEIDIAFKRHATSKIKSIEDLITVSSLGFRGEALASIAAVSQIELLTKTKDSITGTRHLSEGGECLSMEDVGVPEGTTFIVRNLFFNTPVRRKFLKTPMTEAGYINSLMQELALSHPDISFRFINNNQNKLHTSGNMKLKDIIYNIYGKEITANLYEVNAKTQDIQIEGYIGKPFINRGNRTYENYFINGRYIKSGIINRAIEEAYKGFIMPHNYPFTAIHFKISTDIVDVNVHPTKMELRFSNNEYVYNFVYDSVLSTLKGKELVAKAKVDGQVMKEIEKNYAPANVNTSEYIKTDAASKNIETAALNRMSDNKAEQFRSKDKVGDSNKKTISQVNIGLKDGAAAANSKSDIQAGQQESRTIQNATIKDNIAEVNQKELVPRANISSNLGESNKLSSPKRLPEPFEVKRSDAFVKEEEKQYKKEMQETPKQMSIFTDKLLDEENKNAYRIIGQLFETYWLIEFEDRFYMMDQHAAHEKVLFEKMMAKIKNNEAATQMIMPPIILTLGMNEEEALIRNMDIFKKLGYEIEEFGGNEYKVTGVPAGLPKLDYRQMLIDIIDGLLKEGKMGDMDILTEKVASMSCKAAIKGNNKISYAEAKELMSELMKADNPYNCPHGRPTLIVMSKYDIEKKFKRIV